MLSKHITLSHSQIDTLLRHGLRVLALTSSFIVILIILFLFSESFGIVGEISPLRFFTDPGWYPTSEQFNLLPMIVGSLCLMMSALLLAAPLAILTAVFCNFYAPPALAVIVRRLIEIFTAIPSVIYGLWGLVVLVPIIASIQAPGASLLAGSIVLAIMIFPTIAMVSDSVIVAVPKKYIKGAVALGLERYSVIFSVVLPTAKSGLFAGMLLGAARAVGETMAVLMVCGNIVQMPSSLFDPIRALTSNIALEMAYAMDIHRTALFVSGTLLLMLVLILIILNEIYQSKHHHA
ncbi:MAG: phosphate ABC transporter permease subunit PstC [Pseudomonadota bacterium]